MKISNKIKGAVIASLFIGFGFPNAIYAQENIEDHEHAVKSDSLHETDCGKLLACIEKDVLMSEFPLSILKNFVELIKYEWGEFTELTQKPPTEGCNLALQEEEYSSEKSLRELMKLHLDLSSLILLKKICIFEALVGKVHFEKDFLERIMRMDAEVHELYDKFETKDKEFCAEGKELKEIKILSDMILNIEKLQAELQAEKAHSSSP